MHIINALCRTIRIQLSLAQLILLLYIQKMQCSKNVLVEKYLFNVDTEAANLSQVSK